MSQQLIETCRGQMSPEDAASYFGIPEFYARFGQWVVTPHGLECLYVEYDIPVNQLFQTHWVSHMRDKSWVDLGDFVKALDCARKLHKSQAA